MQLQNVFDRIQETKGKIRTVKSMYKDELKSNFEYGKILEQAKELRNRKKQIEKVAREGMAKAFEELQELEAGIKTDKDLLVEVALNDYTSGVTVKVTKQVTDRKGKVEDKTLFPKFSVSFKNV